MGRLIATIVRAAWASMPIAADVTPLLGTWRGTSTCVNLKIAPACHDEVVVYEVRPAEKPGTATLQADKIVDGTRASMGELDFAFDEKEGCWKSEFQNTKVHVVWCLVVNGTGMTGGLRDVPTGEPIRKVELKHE
jgi:hypothetical protein